MAASDAMRCDVGLRAPDGALVELAPGDILGRGWNAALHVDDPRVSEAHAMVSHRDGALWLLALRRRGLAQSLWPDADDRAQLRRRWDVQLARLRARLRAAGIGGELVRPDGKGNFELVLGAEDTVVDET